MVAATARQCSISGGSQAVDAGCCGRLLRFRSVLVKHDRSATPNWGAPGHEPTLNCEQIADDGLELST